LRAHAPAFTGLLDAQPIPDRARRPLKKVNSPKPDLISARGRDHPVTVGTSMLPIAGYQFGAERAVVGRSQCYYGRVGGSRRLTASGTVMSAVPPTNRQPDTGTSGPKSANSGHSATA
jgi:hypothetical protein